MGDQINSYEVFMTLSRIIALFSLNMTFSCVYQISHLLPLVIFTSAPSYIHDVLVSSFSQLMALKSCHDRNITHRDIKPGKDTNAE